MFTKANLISTLAISLWSFFGGYFLWGIMVAPLLEGHVGRAMGVWRDSPNYIHLFLGCFIFAFAFSTIYSRLYGIGHPLFRGVVFGVWVGVLLGLGGGLISLGVTDFTDLTGTLINGVFTMAFYIVMGVLANFAYNNFS